MLLRLVRYRQTMSKAERHICITVLVLALISVVGMTVACLL